MNLTPEEIKKWNDAISVLTAICNHHCTEKGCCGGCPFDALRFRDASGQRSWCPINSAVLYEGDFKVRIGDFIQNELSNALFPAEIRQFVASCKNCEKLQKDGFCPRMGLRLLHPDHRICKGWTPRSDLMKETSSCCS